MATIAVLGALDTNGVEHQFVADCISRHGHQALLIDVGTQGAPQVNPHISREAVVKVAELDLASMGDDPARAQDAMRTAAPIILSTLFRQEKIQGVISLGGGVALPLQHPECARCPWAFQSSSSPHSPTETPHNTPEPKISS